MLEGLRKAIDLIVRNVLPFSSTPPEVGREKKDLNSYASCVAKNAF